MPIPTMQNGRATTILAHTKNKKVKSSRLFCSGVFGAFEVAGGDDDITQVSELQTVQRYRPRESARDSSKNTSMAVSCRILQGELGKMLCKSYQVYTKT